MAETIDVRSGTREEMIDITAQVRAAVRKSGITTGMACVFCPHTTAGVTIQENADPDVRADMIAHLQRMVPQDPRFKHSEGNADSHIKASLVGASTTILVEDGKLVLGTWQAVYFCEFDGPRSRRVLVQVIGNRKAGADV